MTSSSSTPDFGAGSGAIRSVAYDLRFAPGSGRVGAIATVTSDANDPEPTTTAPDPALDPRQAALLRLAPEGGLDRLAEAAGLLPSPHANGESSECGAFPSGSGSFSQTPPSGSGREFRSASDAAPRSASAGRGLVFGGLLGIGFLVWPAQRALALGLDRPPEPELWLGLGAALGGFGCGAVLRRQRRTVPWLGLLAAVVAIALAVAQGCGLPVFEARPTAVGMAVAIGLALGVLAPARGWLPVLASGVGALLLVVIERVLGPVCPTRVQFAVLLLAPAVALLVAGRVRPAALLRLVPGPVAAASAIAVALFYAPAPVPSELRAGIAAARVRLLASHGDAHLVYARASQELQLWQRGQLIDAEGPGRPRSPLVATAVRALTRPGDRVLVLGAGLGRLPRALATAGLPAVEIVHTRLAVQPLLPRAAAIGAVIDPVEPSAAALSFSGSGVSGLRSSGVFGEVRLAGARAVLAGLPAGSRQAIVVGEPVRGEVSFAAASEPTSATTGPRWLPAAAPLADWQCDLAAQRELRRVAGRGLVVQPFAMDRTPPDRLAALLAAAAVAHPTNLVLAVGECGLLLSIDGPWQWPAPDAFACWPAAARWQAHEAHLGSAADLQRAWLGTLDPERLLARAGDRMSAALRADSGARREPTGRRATLRVLHDCLEPAPALAPARGSQLLWWVDLRSRLRAFERSLRVAVAEPMARQRVRAAAAAFLPTGARSAAVQAALALPDDGGTRFVDPEFAALAAFAIDPTFHQERPELLADLPRPRRRFGDLEDLARLPAPARLAELCTENSTLAVALRVRFPSACAHALVAELANGPLPTMRFEALRQLADPFVLAMAGEALTGRGALPELLGLWRRDLAMPPAVALLLRGAEADRQVLAGALAGRRDERSLAALAALMLDPTMSVREAAAGTVAVTGRGRIEFDPKWSHGKRFIAAERVRLLHNRAP